MKYLSLLILFVSSYYRCVAQVEGYTLDNSWKSAADAGKYSPDGFKFKDSPDGLTINASASKYCTVLPIRFANYMKERFIDIRDFTYTVDVQFNEIPKQEAAVGMLFTMGSDQVFDSTNTVHAFGFMFSTAGKLYVQNRSTYKSTETVQWLAGMVEISNFNQIAIESAFNPAIKNTITIIREDKKWTLQINYKDVYTTEVNTLNPFTLFSFPALLFHNKCSVTFGHEKAFLGYSNASMRNYMNSFAIKAGKGMLHSDCLTEEIPVTYELIMVEGLPAMHVKGRFCDATNNIDLTLPFTNKAAGKYAWLNNDIRAKYQWCLANKPFEFDYVDMYPDKAYFSFRIKGDAKVSWIGDNTITRTTECHTYITKVN